ncbi:uncharacterized protein LOC112683942 isoform X1 [Sipha flava]|uniref:Uncharacterized protein LOC112683942 isoform X1 n=1 Tax=Sipha flava TaxID=143950 RepID=A0A8B8FKV3_9HEMI|nr:uncharacterized protein LOC112683942 isoform X1 [Sipha flava]
MNQAIQSFVLKTICFILIINVTLCRSCYNLGCAARCYYSNKGFGYGYCEESNCMCSLPTIYLFNGIERNLNGDSIDSWKYNNHNKNSITTSKSFNDDKSKMFSTYTSNENKRNKIWEEIETKITKQYSFIKKDDLQNLKSKIISNQSALDYFNIHLKNPLKDALKLMEKKEPDTSKECDELLKLLLKYKKTTVSKPQTTRSSQNLPLKGKKSTTPNSKHSATQSIKPEKDNDLKEKTNSKRSVVEEEEEKKQEIYYEVETVEYSDESEEIPKED